MCRQDQTRKTLTLSKTGLAASGLAEDSRAGAAEDDSLGVREDGGDGEAARLYCEIGT